MEQLFFAGKAYLKINSLVKTPLHEFMAVERSGLWAPACVQPPPSPQTRSCECQTLSGCLLAIISQAEGGNPEFLIFGL